MSRWSGMGWRKSEGVSRRMDNYNNTVYLFCQRLIRRLRIVSDT